MNAKPVVYLVEIGAVSLPEGHPARIVLRSYHDTQAEAQAACDDSGGFASKITPLCQCECDE
jgi:hypothetical protein